MLQGGIGASSLNARTNHPQPSYEARPGYASQNAGVRTVLQPAREAAGLYQPFIIPCFAVSGRNSQSPSREMRTNVVCDDEVDIAMASRSEIRMRDVIMDSSRRTARNRLPRGNEKGDEKAG
jgi:hypothetical protein